MTVTNKFDISSKSAQLIIIAENVVSVPYYAGSITWTIMMVLCSKFKFDLYITNCSRMFCSKKHMSVFQRKPKNADCSTKCYLWSSLMSEARLFKESLGNSVTFYRACLVSEIRTLYSLTSHELYFFQCLVQALINCKRIQIKRIIWWR